MKLHELTVELNQIDNWTEQRDIDVYAVVRGEVCTIEGIMCTKDSNNKHKLFIKLEEHGKVKYPIVGGKKYGK